MITPTKIANILYQDCKALGIPIVPFGKTIVGDLKDERVVIKSKRQRPGKIWKKSFVEVNICVPDLSPNEAAAIRLEELEGIAGGVFDDIVGSYNGTSYHYSVESLGTERDESLKCHYVNVRILFEVLNVN